MLDAAAKVSMAAASFERIFFFELITSPNYQQFLSLLGLNARKGDAFLESRPFLLTKRVMCSVRKINTHIYGENGMDKKMED